MKTYGWKLREKRNERHIEDVTIISFSICSALGEIKIVSLLIWGYGIPELAEERIIWGKRAHVLVLLIIIVYWLSILECIDHTRNLTVLVFGAQTETEVPKNWLQTVFDPRITLTYQTLM